MPKNPNKPNQERQTPNRGKESDEPSRKASSGKETGNQPSRQGTSGNESGSNESGRNESERGQQKGGERSASSSRNAGADRGIDRSRTEPNPTEESTRQGRGKESEGLDVDELDEQNQGL